jgi:hypothetical protein
MSALLYTTTTGCTRSNRDADHHHHLLHPAAAAHNQVIFLDDDAEEIFPQQQQRPIPILHPLVNNLQRIFAGETISTARDFVDLWLFPSLVLICIHATRGAAGCLKGGLGLGDCL